MLEAAQNSASDELCSASEFIEIYSRLNSRGAYSPSLLRGVHCF